MKAGIIPSPELLELLKTEANLDQDEEELVSSYEKCLGDRKGVLSFGIIKKAYEQLNAKKTERRYLHEMLIGSEIAFQLPDPPPRNPILEARIQRLKAEQDQREYKQMTANISSPTHDRLSFGSEIKIVRSQLIAVANFVLTVGGTFVFVYKAVEYILPTPNVSAQVLCAILAATVFAIAELYFLLKVV